MVDSSAIKRASIYCRIRPLVYDGGGHDMNGQAVMKSLKEWSDTSITLDTQYMFSKGASEYKFPKKVFKPEATQVEVYEEFDPLVQEFTSTPGRNAMILAYG
jgi:hypothetical protein